MQDYSLVRTGKSNLEFHGELIAEAKSPAYRRHEKNPTARAHWYEAYVYLTRGGKYILHVLYRFAGPLNREILQDYVFVHDDIDGVIQSMKEFSPTDCVTGYPDGEHWEKKQQILMNDLDGDFDLLEELIHSKLQRLKEPERID